VGELDDILRVAAERNASDLHLQVGLPPVLRIQKRLVPLPGAALDAAATERLIVSIMSEQQKRLFAERLELDFSYGLRGLARFRVNAFRERDAVAGAFRRFPLEVPAPEALGLPRAVIELARLRRGFVLITGAAGQGKSTTLASLIDRINRDREAHIITLEDPIEYLFQHRASIVVQRELGNDTRSFAGALRAALREDPDVILVGEMRDTRTVEAALTAAETGHLVFATLHTQNAAQSVDRIVDVFPPHQQPQTRVQLSNVLRAVVTQQLLIRRDGAGLCVAVELLLANAAIRNLIRDAKTYQIQSVLQTGVAAGMVTMEGSLKALCERGLISVEDAMEHAIDDKEMARLLGLGR
jgi:twitching motility protein PilT